MIPDGQGVPDLGRRAQVIIRESRIIAPGMIELREEGLATPGCTHHLRMVDIVTGVAWLLPLTRQMIAELHDAAEMADLGLTESKD